MPTWLYVAIWIIWIVFTLDEFLITYLIANRNKNSAYVERYGKVYKSPYGQLASFVWFIFTAFWLSYVFFG